MNLIVSRKQDGVMIGGILFNGSPIGKCAFNVAYVQSTDVQIGEFTVLQSLYFAALLRLDSHNGFKKEDCHDRCVHVAASVGLTDVLNTVIGSALVKGISGGQMRRLTIATELLADPHIVCLDEPTTGLDSATSLQLAIMLNNLAVQNHKTIVCTVHQPSDDMLNVWDRLVLMGSGRVIYSGEVDGLAGHMRRGGHVVSRFQNGLEEGGSKDISKSDCVEFVLELLHDAATLDILAAQWSAADQSPSNASYACVEDGAAKEETDLSAATPVRGQFAPFDFEHVKVLIHRHALYSMLSAEGIRSIIARNVISGSIYSILYYQNFSILMKTGYVVSIVGTDFVSEFYNMMGLVYSIVTNVFMMNAVSVPALFQLNRFYSVEKVCASVDYLFVVYQYYFYLFATLL
jgi:ABC-type multidrug transport system ATPase subunit